MHDSIQQQPHAQDTYTQVFAENLSLSAGTEEDLWEPGTAYPWPTVPTTLRVAAGVAADAPGGAGARSVLVSGLDANFDPIEETLATGGAGAGPPGVLSFIRINSCSVVDAGTYTGSNVGAVQIENGGGGTVLAYMNPTHGEASQSMWTVPRGYKAWLLGAFVSVAGGKAAAVRMWQRPRANVVGAPFASRRHIITLPDLDGFSDFPLQSFVEFGEMTDLWFTATADSGGSGSSASVRYDLRLRPVPR